MISHGYIVPVAFFAMIVGIIAVVNYGHYRVRKLRSRERLAAIEKGLLLTDGDFATDASDPLRAAARTRLTAITLVAVGVGTAATFAILAWVVQQREVLSAAAFAIIPFAIGIGMLVDYRLQMRAVEAAKDEVVQNRLPA